MVLEEKAYSVETNELGSCIPIDVSVTEGGERRLVTLREQMKPRVLPAPGWMREERGVETFESPPNLRQLTDWAKAFVVEFALKTFGAGVARTLAKEWQCDENAPHFFIYRLRVVAEGVGVSFHFTWHGRDGKTLKPLEEPVESVIILVKGVKLEHGPLPSDAVVLNNELHVGAREIDGRTVQCYAGGELVYCFEPIILGGEQAKARVARMVAEQFARVLEGRMNNLAGRNETLSREEIRELGFKTKVWEQARQLFLQARGKNEGVRRAEQQKLNSLLARGVRR